MLPVPGGLGHVADLKVLAILHVGGVLGRVAVPKYVLAGLIQFLEIVTLPRTAGGWIDTISSTSEDHGSWWSG